MVKYQKPKRKELPSPERPCPLPLGRSRQAYRPANNPRHLTLNTARSRKPPRAPPAPFTAHQHPSNIPNSSQAAGDADWEAFAPRLTARAPPRQGRAERRGRAAANAALARGWQAAQPQLLHRRLIAEQGSARQQQAVADSLQAELQRRLSTAPITCSCGHAMASNSGQTAQVHLVHLQGMLTSPSLPSYRCSACCKCMHPQPTDLGYFPATPTRAEIWYDQQLLLLAQEIKLRGSCSWTSIGQSFGRLHEHNGLSSIPAAWRHLQEACMQWQKVERSCRDPATYGVAPPPHCESHQRCPCCWRECHGAVFDCCLGLTRFRRAAVSSQSIQAALSDSRFAPDLLVRQSLAADRGIAFHTGECSTFTAASVHGRRSEQLHIHGLAAGVCRHEILLAACKLFTSENFTYYEELLARLLRQFDREGGRRLTYFYLDIACQFQKWWERWVIACQQHLCATNSAWPPQLLTSITCHNCRLPRAILVRQH